MGTLLTYATLRGSLAQIRHVAPVVPRAARGATAEVYRQVRRDFGMLAPPVILHAPADDALAACWLMLRESLLATGAASRARKEAVATAVSLANACPYCVEVHATALHGLVRRRHATAVTADAPQSIDDPALRTVVEWARHSGTSAGARHHRLLLPPDQAAELIAVAVTFQYLNRMVNLFLDASPLPPGVPAAARGPLRQLGGWLLAATTRRDRAPGHALGLLPAARLPAELSWASGSPRLAAAFARADAALERCGARSVPPAVRALVLARLRDWDGAPAGVGRGWVEVAAAGLPARDRDAGRLALLTAFASYQVDNSMMDRCRRRYPGDRSLIEFAAWVSFAAARRAGAMMSGAVSPDTAPPGTVPSGTR